MIHDDHHHGFDAKALHFETVLVVFFFLEKKRGQKIQCQRVFLDPSSSTRGLHPCLSFLLSRATKRLNKYCCFSLSLSRARKQQRLKRFWSVDAETTTTLQQLLKRFSSQSRRREIPRTKTISLYTHKLIDRCSESDPFETLCFGNRKDPKPVLLLAKKLEAIGTLIRTFFGTFGRSRTRRRQSRRSHHHHHLLCL